MLIELIVAAAAVIIVCVIDASSFMLDEDTEKLLYYEAEQEDSECGVDGVNSMATVDTVEQESMEFGVGGEFADAGASAECGVMQGVEVNEDREFVGAYAEGEATQSQQAPNAGRRVSTSTPHELNAGKRVSSRTLSAGDAMTNEVLQGMTDEFINEVCREVENG